MMNLICAGLVELRQKAFTWTNLKDLSIEDGNLSSRVRGGFLLNCECTRMFGYFGGAEAIVIPGGVEEWGCDCFSGNKIVSSMTFESGCKVVRIGSSAFEDCSSLSSICIPASVEILCKRCFCECQALSAVASESGSKLLRIESEAFRGCSSLASICIPSSVTVIGERCFLWCPAGLSVRFEPGSKLSSGPEGGGAIFDPERDPSADLFDL
jgi:hypothetical protein